VLLLANSYRRRPERVRFALRPAPGVEECAPDRRHALVAHYHPVGGGHSLQRPAIVNTVRMNQRADVWTRPLPSH
jgi:hypothetical protein